MKMDGFSFSNAHIKEENINAVFVPSFCHPVAEADLFNFMRFQTCNGDSGILSDALPELRLIKQTKAFLMHSQTENVSDKIIHISVLLKMYICISNL